MRFRRSLFLLAGLFVSPAFPAVAQRPAPLTEGLIRICADPDNLPSSNDKSQGFENKIAELLAQFWGSRLEYAWWPVRRGYFSRALNGRYCDVAITAPSGLDIAGVTKPYFRSSYVFVTRVDRHLDITSLDDPRLKTLKIGVNLLNSDAENTPPAMALSSHGVVGNLVGFATFFSEGGERPQDIITAVVDGTVDIAIVWGPLAGYFARDAAAPLTLTPVPDDSVSGMPFEFSFGMGVRRRDHELRDSLQKAIDSLQPQITAILKDYGVPLLPLPPDTAQQVGTAQPQTQ